MAVVNLESLSTFPRRSFTIHLFLEGILMKLSHAQQRFCQWAALSDRLESEHYSPSDRLKVKVATALEKKGILQRIEPMTLVFTAYGKQLAQSLIPQGKTEDE